LHKYYENLVMENVYSSYADILSYPGSLYAYTMISMLKCKKKVEQGGMWVKQGKGV
jgi:hypothetical protein